MGTIVSLVVPEQERTLQTGRRFYEYHVDHSEYDESLHDPVEFDSFVDALEEGGKFGIWKKPTRRVVAAAEGPARDVLSAHADDGNTIGDPEGLDALHEWLESARDTLATTGRLSVGDDRTIELCQHIVEFARVNGYAVEYGY